MKKIKKWDSFNEMIDESNKIKELLNQKQQTIVNDILKNIDDKSENVDYSEEELQYIKQWIKDDAHMYISSSGLQPISDETSTDWRSDESIYDNLINGFVEQTYNKYFK